MGAILKQLIYTVWHTVGTLIIAAISGFILAGPTMWTWSQFAVEVLGYPPIEFLDAFYLCSAVIAILNAGNIRLPGKLSL